MQKYLFLKSSSSVNIFIQNNSSAKKLAVPPKKHLFSRSGYPIEVWRWKSSYSKKITAAKKLLSQKVAHQKSSYSEETTAPKKLLLCPSSFSEGVLRTSSSENKAVLKKWLHMPEEKLSFETAILSLWKYSEGIRDVLRNPVVNLRWSFLWK